MTGYFCPVEGCDKHADEWTDDQSPFASREAVRGHMNAKSDDDHQRARDEGVWKQAPEAPKGGDGEGDETSDEQPTDQEESSDEQATDQRNEGGEEPLEEDDQMVSPEEYQQQQESTSETEGSEGDDDQRTTGDDQRNEGGLVPSLRLPEIPPMYAFTIIAAVFAAIVIWRVMKARSSDEHVAIEDDDEDELVPEQQTGMTLIEQ